MESVTVQQVPTTAGWNRDQTSARFFSLLIYARNPVFVAHVPGYLTGSGANPHLMSVGDPDGHSNVFLLCIRNTASTRLAAHI